MKHKIVLFTIIATIFASCHQNHTAPNRDKHHDEKTTFTAYSNDFELFAEADVFVAGKSSNVLSHFSELPEFKALESGTVTIRLQVNGNETAQTLEKPSRKGVYSFDITPKTAGVGRVQIDIQTVKGNLQVVVPNITVYQTEAEADQAAENAHVSKTNTTVFTKEQSWKIDFSSDYPTIEPFGQVIKTTAQVEMAQGSEAIISAKTNGVVFLSDNSILEGKDVSNGQVLFSISGNELANNNSAVRFSEAKSNFEKASADYERSEELVKSRIVSQKDFLETKNQYENAKAIFDNLNKNFSTAGQRVSSPMNGFINQIFVKNGSYVEAGQSIATISQNKTLVLSADVQQKYANLLGTIKSANIRTLYDNKTYSLEQLNGRVLSFGKAANSDNYLIPMKLQIDNKGTFTSGGFVEIYLKTVSNVEALTLPNTALLEEQGSYFAYVQVTPELFEKREIKIGTTDGLKTEILSGIAPDERVVTKGAIMIKLSQATGTLDAHSGHVH